MLYVPRHDTGGPNQINSSLPSLQIDVEGEIKQDHLVENRWTEKRGEQVNIS
jgi:hypothetical protein